MTTIDWRLSSVELEARYEGAADPIGKSHFHALWLLSSGYGVEEVAELFGQGIATRTEPLKAFYPAEAYHQDYLVLHPNNPYIVYNDLPKLEALKRLFPEFYRAEPRLVAAQRPPF